MKVGVSSYSFSRLVRSGVMSQLDVVAKTKEMGFDVIEFSKLTLPEGIGLPDFARQLRETCEQVGIAAMNYTIGADFLRGSNGSWQAEVERLKNEVRVAQILGVPGMRHDASAGFPPEHVGARAFDDALPILAKACRAVTAFAADHGIRTMVENHGHFCQDSERVEKLVSAVNHPNFGVLLDMGNFVCVDEDPAVATGRLAPCTFHVHAKDFHIKPGTAPWPGDGWAYTRAGNLRRGAIIGHGDVPVVQCLRVLKRQGYDGVVSIEFEGIEEVLTGIAYGQAALRRFVADAERG